MPITKSRFLEVFNAHPFNKWTVFIYKYYSKETKIEDLWLRRLTTWSMMVMFAFGFIFTILKSNEVITEQLYRSVVGTATLIYGIILVSIVLGGFVAVFMKNANIRKIRKKLLLTRKEYNECVKRYL